MDQSRVVRAAMASCAVAELAGCAAAARPARTVDRPPAEAEKLVPAAPAQAGRLEINVLSVSVQPARITRGESVDLVVGYTVAGLPAGASIDVEEQRELLKDGTTIVQLSDPLLRTGGSHTSARSVRVPADAAPGVYTLRISLRAPGSQAAGTALFEVR